MQPQVFSVRDGSRESVPNASCGREWNSDTARVSLQAIHSHCSQCDPSSTEVSRTPTKNAPKLRQSPWVPLPPGDNVAMAEGVPGRSATRSSTLAAGPKQRPVRVLYALGKKRTANVCFSELSHHGRRRVEP